MLIANSLSASSFTCKPLACANESELFICTDKIGLLEVTFYINTEY